MGEQGRILLVDDEPSILAASKSCLGRGGFDVSIASNGLEALNQLKDDRFDAIISDIAMPGLNGLELLRAVRDHDLDVPVVLMTGGPSVESAIEALEYGALRYLTKPVRPDELLRVAANAVRMRRMADLKREALDLLGAHQKQLGDLASLETNFERALEGIWMAYQPIVDWGSRKVFAYEALVRSREESMPHPGALFDAAERLERVKDLGEAIRKQVAEDLTKSDTNFTIFVNLHPEDLTDERLYDENAPLVPWAQRMVFEITERASLTGLGDVKSQVARLRALGFRVAIDDLGAGYAGLSSFALLEPDILKIDMSLTRGVDEDGTKQRVIRSMLSLGDEMSMQVIVEGIETMAERDTLVDLGANLLQGYLFAKPSPPFIEVGF